ncbi:hypothetical protein TI06_23625, partial [Vibrio vulnificus]
RNRATTCSRRAARRRRISCRWRKPSASPGSASTTARCNCAGRSRRATTCTRSACASTDSTRPCSRSCRPAKATATS